MDQFDGFSNQEKQQYLDALNLAMRAHPQFKDGMEFIDMILVAGCIEFIVAPSTVRPDTPFYKVFEDIANVLTLNGSTLPYIIRPA